MKFSTTDTNRRSSGVKKVEKASGRLEALDKSLRIVMRGTVRVAKASKSLQSFDGAWLGAAGQNGHLAKASKSLQSFDGEIVTLSVAKTNWQRHRRAFNPSTSMRARRAWWPATQRVLNPSKLETKAIATVVWSRDPAEPTPQNSETPDRSRGLRQSACRRSDC